MTEYYFDIETLGTDPQQDKIITIQYQKLEDGEPVEDLVILKEWESSEGEIVKEILDKQLLEPGWDFLPVGNRLKFDIIFIMEKAKQHNLLDWKPGDLKYYFFNKPMLDVASILVMMNDLKFLGSGIDSFTNKKKGSIIPVHYNKREFDEIIKYIEVERDAVVGLLAEVRAVLSTFGNRKKAALEEEKLKARSEEPQQE
jgi:hypothetical protein